MARYIDADKLKGWLRLDQAGTKNTVTHQSEGLHPIRIMQLKCFIGDIEYCLSKINEAPTADVVEVKHGEWLKTDAYPHRVYCSLCYKIYVTNEEVIQGRGWGHPLYCTEAEYCPHCGARMDEKKVE